MENGEWSWSVPETPAKKIWKETEIIDETADEIDVPPTPPPIPLPLPPPPPPLPEELRQKQTATIKKNEDPFKGFETAMKDFMEKMENGRMKIDKMYAEAELSMEKMHAGFRGKSAKLSME